MNQEQWTSVDHYFNSCLVPNDPALDAALAATAEANLPLINVAPNQGKMLNLLALLTHAKKILEVGTLGGYSTIWLARALPKEGKLISLEYDPKHAAVALSNIKNAGLGAYVEIRVGAALDTLPKLEAEGAGPFDFIFIDADKSNNAGYLEWALKLSHIGTLIVCDNVVRNGTVADPDQTEPDVVGTRKFFDLLSKEERLSATAIQTVGSKGYDGFAMALVIE
jgi:predicted O-methyltransferase YrrM